MERLFYRVLNMSISAAAVIAVVVLMRLLLRSAPKKWRYLLWSAVGFRLCCPVSFKAVFSLFRLRPSIMNSVGGAENAVIQAQSMPSAAQLAVPAASAAPAAAVITPAAVPAVIPAASMPVPEPVRLWPSLGIVLWLCGMTVMLVLGIIRYIRMKRGLADAAALEKGVFATDRIRVPFILGLLPPRVYVPAGLGEEERTYVLAHERVHIHRGDHWVKLLAYFMLAVHWFNPAVWAAFFLMSRDMEMSCDERVLRDLGGQAKAYSSTLLRFAEGRQFPAPAPLGFGESDVKSRIKNALRWKKPKLWITLAATVLCIAAVAACTADPKEPKETDMQVTAGDTVCFSREDETICLRGTKESRSFGEILDGLALTGFTYSEEENVLSLDKRLLPGQKQLTVGMDKASVLQDLYAGKPVGTEDALFLAENHPGVTVGNGEGGYLRLSGVFAGEPFGMTLGYAGTYADLLQRVVLTFWPPEEGKTVYTRAEDGKAVYARVKEALELQLGEPDAAVDFSAGWNFPGGALDVTMTEKDDYTSVYILLTGEVRADTPWSWTSNLKSSDIREAVLRSSSAPTELLLDWAQIRELAALLRAVPKDQVAGGRGIPSERVLELRDTGYALRFAGGVIELDCERPIYSASPAPVWEIRDEALYAWLDALWEGSPFGQAADPLGLTLRVEDLTPMGCTLVFTQSGGSVTGELETEEQFRLFRQDADGSWKELIYANYLGTALHIEPDNSTALETYWGGALEAGRYRIKKKVLDFRGTGDFDEYAIYAEFEITGGQTEALLGLTMRAKDVTPTGCTLVFAQSGGAVTGELQTGAAYTLFQRDADGNWIELPKNKEAVWYSLAYGIKKNGTTELGAEWESLYGALKDGHYRIRKEIIDYRAPGEFDTYTIDTEFNISGGAGETMSNWFAMIPEGYAFSPYGNYGWEGGFLILPEVYVRENNGGTAPIEWRYSGLVTRISAQNTQLTFQNGIPEWHGLPTQNHTVTEFLGIGPSAQNRNGWQVIRLKETHDLYTPAEIAELEKEGINTGAIDLTSEYWTFWLVKEGADTYYQVSLASKTFSEETAIRFVQTMTGDWEHEAQTELIDSLGYSRFDVKADKYHTTASGTIEIFAKEQGVLGIRILADLTIGPEDWGGVAFYLPAGCGLESVSCTYPETDGAAAEDPPVNVWTTAAENEEYTTMIEIGRDRSKKYSGGGTGTVVIEVSCPWDSSDPIHSLTFGVECGAEEKNGYMIMGVEHSEIAVEIRSP